MMKLGKPIKYMALPPSEVINIIKKKIKEESIVKEQLMEDLKSSQILNQLTELHTNGIDMIEPTDMVGLVKDRVNLYNHIDSMIKNAEKTVYIMTSQEGLTRKIQHMKKTLKKLMDKGVSIKIIIPQTKDINKYSEELKDIAEVKVVSGMNARFVIVDNQNILFMLTDDKGVHPSYDVGVWVRTPYFATVLKEMFEQTWKKKEVK